MNIYMFLPLKLSGIIVLFIPFGPASWGFFYSARTSKTFCTLVQAVVETRA